jgi:hypothetical protein
LCPVMTSIHWRNGLRSLAAWGLREDKLQVADSHCTALDNAQTCFAKDGFDFGETDVTMTMKMSDDASLLRRGGSEIDGQHPAAGLEHSSNLGSALAAELARQMMQHHRAQHHVELSIGERQRLDQRVLEDNLDPSLARLLVGPREHLRRGVNPVHCVCGSNLALGRDRKRASSAAHIQDLLAGGQACEAKDLFPKSTFSTERQQPEREVIERRLVKDEAGGLSRGMRKNRGCGIVR